MMLFGYTRERTIEELKRMPFYDDNLWPYLMRMKYTMLTTTVPYRTERMRINDYDSAARYVSNIYAHGDGDDSDKVRSAINQLKIAVLSNMNLGPDDDKARALLYCCSKVIHYAHYGDKGLLRTTDRDSFSHQVLDSPAMWLGFKMRQTWLENNKTVGIQPQVSNRHLLATDVDIRGMLTYVRRRYATCAVACRPPPTRRCRSRVC